MLDTLSFAELDAQHVELLPARTVLSTLFIDMGGGSTGDNNNGGKHINIHKNIHNVTHTGGAGGNASGCNGLLNCNAINLGILSGGSQTAIAGVFGGSGGNAR